MPRPLRIALLCAAAIGVLIAIGLTVFVSTFDAARYVERAAAEVEKATGRKLTIGGKIDVRVFPRVAIAAEEVSLSNAPWGSRPIMISIARVEAKLALSALLFGKVHFESLRLVEPDLLLETDAKGVGNWVMKTQSPASAAPASRTDQAAFAISGLEIEDGAVSWRRNGDKKPLALAIEKLKLSEQALGTSYSLDLQGALRDQPFAAKGTIGSIERLLAKDDAWPVDLKLETAGSKASVVGRVNWSEAAPGLDAVVEVSIADEAGIAKLLGTGMSMPTPLSLSTKLATSPGEQRADPFLLKAGKTGAEGSIVIRRGGARPFITAQLKSRELDLASGRKAAAKHPGRVFGPAPFPTEGLRNLDGEFDVAIERLVMPSRLVLENLKLHAALRNGRLEMQPLAATVAGGALRGAIALDASRPKTPTLALHLDGKAMSMERLAADFGRPGAVKGGRMDLAVQLTGPGESPQSFMGAANGELQLVMSQAQLSGTVLEIGGDVLTRVLELANPFQRTDAITELRCGVIRLPVKNGIGTSQRSIAYETSKINLVAAGTVNFRTEALDLALKPTIKEGLGLGAATLADVVRVTGTLSSPSVGVDTLGSARAALSVAGAVLTSGLSLLGEALLSRGTADPNPCKTALGGAPSSREAAPPAPEESGGLEGVFRRIFK